MVERDFTRLTPDERINGIKATKLPDYFRTKYHGGDVRETFAQLSEMMIQLGINMGLSPEESLKWARKLQEAVPRSEFDSWVATLLDGGPSIFMNTLSELKAAYPNGAPGIALVRETDPAKIYIWNGTAWENFGDYQGIEIKDGTVNTKKITEKAVTFTKTDFIESLDNLFEGWNDRFYLNGDNVQLTYNPTNTSYFGTIIPIEPSTNYQIALEDGFSGLFKYGTDSRTNFTSSQNLNGSVKVGSNAGTVGDLFTFTSGTSDAYLYITSDTDVAMNVSNLSGRRGRSVETLMPVEFKNLSLTDIEGVGIKNDSMPIGKLEHITSPNVFNYRTVTAGYYLDRYTGNLVENADNSVSDYIPIKVGKTKLTFDKLDLGNVNYGFYKNRNFIEGGQILVGDLTTPQSVPINTLADEFRFSIANTNNLKSYRVEFGDTLSPSSEYYNYPNGLVLPKSDPLDPDIYLSETRAVISMGNTEYTIEHEVTPFTDGGLYQNKDTWRIVSCTVDGLKAYQSGAWETAIQVEGLSDFMGTFHGYEGTDSISFYADDKKITAGNFNANEILIVVKGKLFRHGTLDDVVATFTRSYTFKDGKLKLNQKFNWLSEFELKNAYLAMQPIKRTVNDDGTGSNITTTVLTDLDYKEYDVSSVNSNLPIKNYVDGVNFAQIWGEDVGASITVEAKDEDIAIYLWQAPQYNKIYFTYKRNSHIAIGDKWDFTTTYNVAEPSRVRAEGQRKSELAGKADKVVLKNLVENGDFSNGLTDWVGNIGVILEQIPDGLSFNTDSVTGLYYSADNTVSKGEIKSGDIIYSNISGVIEGNMPNNITIELRGSLAEKVLVIKPKGLGNAFTYSGIHKFNDSMSFSIIRYLYIFAPSDDVSVKNILRNTSTINLTETFGAGNEPTKEEMDELIKVTGYIDGEYALNNKEMLGHLMKGIREKANKKQEDWITATLMNGATGDVKYRKNDFGRVEFTGYINFPTEYTSGYVMSIASGYRPKDDLYLPAGLNTFGVGSVLYFRTFSNGNSVWANNFWAGRTAYLDGLSYFN